jgi:hypothetical protein
MAERSSKWTPRCAARKRGAPESLDLKATDRTRESRISVAITVRH